MLEGRSSVGRLGLAVHITAGFGDDGFAGQWVLELATTHPLKVYPGVAICQVAYTAIVGESSAYRGKYQGQRGPVPSGLWKEFAQNKTR
jgi:dCTP deaminase